MLFIGLKLIHLFSIIVWVGGMIFAHVCLRPAVAQLEPPLRLRLMQDVLSRFFNAVLWASCLTIASGLGLVALTSITVKQLGGTFQMPLNWTVMATIGLAMLAIFLHIRFVMFKRLTQAVAQQQWANGAAAMNAIRQLVSTNLLLGIITVIVALLT